MANEVTMKFSAPAPSRLTKDSIQRLAERVSSQMSVDPADGLDGMISKIEGIGGKVEWKNFWEFSDAETGSAEIRAENDFTIYLPTHTSVERDRFTLAHELGHYVLHFLWNKKHAGRAQPIKVNRYGSDRVEWEANWFAASFLMPSAKFKATFVALHGDIVSVASSFGVSSAAAEVRAKALDLI